ncbi:MAG: hypothetical protein JNK48_14125 [Bryobacterales bacterium]|nr:hypothetical protein [Bryobacterales bacterium]
MLLRLLLVIVSLAPAFAQVCRLSVAGLNRERKVMGPVSAECPDPLHSAPFGNWGVTSNFGGKLNGRQFDGWCHDIRICENDGACRNVCRDGWYEWNSCTTNARFQPPNCTLYNAKDCTEQASTTGINVLGTQTADIAVSCPSASPGSASLDRGGCNDVRNYSRTNNFMSLYELDPVTGDELIQTMYFPALLVDLKCNAWGCPPTGSNWLAPLGYDSPVSPAKVFAEMAMVVNSGTFLDSGNVCRIPQLSVQAVSSATLAGPVAPDSLATLFSGDVTALTEQPTGSALPATLGGIQVRVTDAGGTARLAPLLYVSPRQINMVVPAGTREGNAAVAILAGNTTRAAGTMQITRVQPGIFTANGQGTGVAAAAGIRVAADGTQTSQLSFTCVDGVCNAAPLDMGSSAEQFVLSLYGTGIRGISGTDAVRATVNGLQTQVLYAGRQPTFAGLDQVNLLLPKTLAGAGMAVVQLSVDGQSANAVLVWLR